MNSDILKAIKRIEDRLNIIEGVLFKKNTGPTKPTSNPYKGLAGGIRLLIDNKFFDSPKTISEIIEELKRENYHYPRPSINKIISVDFTKDQRILNRIKDGKSYKYVLRK